MAYTLHSFEVLASGLQDEQINIESLIRSCSEPDIVIKRLQETHLLLEALVIHVERIVPRLRAIGNKRWPSIVTKGTNSFNK